MDVLFHFPSRSQNTCNRTYGKTRNTHKDLTDYDKIIRAPARNKTALLQDVSYPPRLLNGNFAGKQQWTDRCLLASQSQNISCNTLLDGWQIALLRMNTPSISMVTYPGEHFAWRHSKRVNIKLKPGRLSNLVSYWFINTTQTILPSVGSCWNSIKFATGNCCHLTALSRSSKIETLISVSHISHIFLTFIRCGIPIVILVLSLSK